MPGVKSYIKASSVINLESTESETKQKLKSVDVQIEVSKNISMEAYLTTERRLNKEGMNVVTQAFVQGIVANIHAAHQAGFIDSAEHLRYVISEIEKGFVELGDVEFFKK